MNISMSDPNEVASDNDDDKNDDDDNDDDDDDDANRQSVEVVEISKGEALTMLDRLVNLKLLIKGRKLSCRHERQIREDKSAEQKASVII